jgi:hypothetical protein
MAACQERQYQVSWRQPIEHPGGPIDPTGDDDPLARGQTLYRGSRHLFRGLPHHLGKRRFGILVTNSGDLAETRLHRARAQRGSGDAAAAKLPAKRFGLRQHKRFGCPVRRLPGHRAERAHGGHVENGTPPSIDHAGQEPAAEVDDRGDVHLDEVEFLLWNGFRDRADRRQARIVDQDVDGYAESGDAVGQRGAIPTQRQIRGQRLCPASKFTGQPLEDVPASSHQHQSVSAVREFACDGLADSG